MNVTKLKTQQAVDFLYNLLCERFNQVNTFTPFKFNPSKITSCINAFHKDTHLGTVTVSVISFDTNPNDNSEYFRIVTFLGKSFKF